MPQQDPFAQRNPASPAVSGATPVLTFHCIESGASRPYYIIFEDGLFRLLDDKRIVVPAPAESLNPYRLVYYPDSVLNANSEPLIVLDVLPESTLRCDDRVGRGFHSVKISAQITILLSSGPHCDLNCKIAVESGTFRCTQFDLSTHPRTPPYAGTLLRLYDGEIDPKPTSLVAMIAGLEKTRGWQFPLPSGTNTDCFFGTTHLNDKETIFENVPPSLAPGGRALYEVFLRFPKHPGRSFHSLVASVSFEQIETGVLRVSTYRDDEQCFVNAGRSLNDDLGKMTRAEARRLRIYARSAELEAGPAKVFLRESTQGRAVVLPQRKVILEVHGLPTRIARTHWNDFVRLYFQSLNTVRGGKPVSFLPQLGIEDSSAEWVMLYEVFDFHSKAYAAEFPLIGACVEAESIDMQSYAKPHSIHPTDIPGGIPEEKLLLRGSIPQIANALDGRGIQNIQLQLQPGKPDEATRLIWDDVPGIHLRLAKRIVIAGEQGQAAEQSRIRMGAFDILLTKLDVRESAKEEARPNRASIRPGNDRGLVVDSSLEYSIAQILPGGQDTAAVDEYAPSNFFDDSSGYACENGWVVKVPRGALAKDVPREVQLEQMYQRPEPLLVALAQEASQNQSNYYLQATEFSGAKAFSQSLDLNLFVKSGAAKPMAPGQAICDPMLAKEWVVVLDRSPYFAAKVEYLPLIGAAGGSRPFGKWSNRDQRVNGWQILFKGQPSCLTLPPQGIGETMLKAKEDSGGSFPLPFNFAPQTQLALNAGNNDKDYTAAPWNLREILSGRTDASTIERIDFELLYGLSCNTQTNPFLRLLETFAAVGEIPQRPRKNLAWDDLPTDGQATAYQIHRQQWAATFQRYGSRLGVFEPIPLSAGATQQSSLFPNSTLSCWFRLPEASNLKAPVALPNEYPQGTLMGGATWGFESKNVYLASIYQPGGQQLARLSDSAELANFAITALGGYGSQMAGFQNNLTRVYGDVHLGRTYRYKLERYGRIAIFYNTAKHVVVFERTVIPSRQFLGDQNPLPGWPALRKVAEYIEIVEDKKDYRDSSSTSGLTKEQREELERARGCVNGQSFPPGARFNVKSEWGSDVRDEGWKVPLWNSTAEPSDLYPKPAIQILMAPEAASAKEHEPQQYKNPEQIYFYTQTKGYRGKSDPDGDAGNWPAVEGVDYFNYPDSVPPAGDFKGGDFRQYSGLDAAVPPGMGGCTFHLEPAAAPVNFMAGRNGQSMAAQLETVTLSRSSNIGRPDQVPDLLRRLASIEGDITAIFGDLLKQLPLRIAQIPLGNFAADMKARITGEIQNQFTILEQKIDQIKSDLDNTYASGVQDKIKGLEDSGLVRLLARLDKEATDAAKRANARIEELKLEPFDEGKARSVLNELAQDLSEQLLLLESMPGRTTRYVTQIAEAVARYARDATKAIDDLSNAAAVANTQIGSLLPMLAALRATLQMRLDAVLRPGSIPPLPGIADPGAALRAILSVYLAGADTQFAELLQGLGAAGNIDDFRKRLNDFRESQLFKALQNSEAIKTFLLNYAGLALVASEWTALLAEINVKVHQSKDVLIRTWQEEVKTVTGAAITTLGDAQNAVNNLSDHILTEAGLIRSQLRKLSKDAQAQSAKVKDLISDATGQLKTKLRLLRDQLVALCDKAIADATADLDSFAKSLTQYRDEVASDARKWLDQNIGPVIAANGGAYQVADTAIRLGRAFGDPPKTPQMEFERSKIGYYFKKELPDVDISPVMTVLNQGAAALDAIKPLGIRLPAIAISDQLIPPSLRGIGVAEIMSHFAGLADLASLLPGLKLPSSLNNDQIKVQQGFDVQRRRGYAKATVKFKTDEPAKLFNFGPLCLEIPTAAFDAFLSIATDENNQIAREVNGSITGDWKLSLSGTPVMTFGDASLLFNDHGGLRFNINPTKIVLPEVLKFVTEKLSSLVDPDSGLSFGAIPNGFQCVLDLPVPDVQGATTGISGLRLAAALQLKFADAFEIGLSCSLGRRDAPFSLAVFILGGGGFFEIGSAYVPSTGKISCTLELSITASASLAIALGPIRGGVYVYLGITASYNSNSSAFPFGVVYIIRGDVCLAGIVRAYVSLTLSATYNSVDKKLTGTGRLVVRIKICWFFTFELDEHVSYTVSAGSGSASNRQDGPIYLASGNGVVSDAPQIELRQLAQVRPSGAKPTLAPASPKAPTIEEAAQQYVSMLL